MTTPAEAYAAARARASASGSARAAFEQLFAFPLDDFQIRACDAVEAGRGVLVAAPTGAGKTVVGEFAVQLAVTRGQKAFYTTPIKALSNQKYADLIRRHGAANVGLLTGDSSVNGEAPVVVMTTEVLRNMLYAGSPTLTGLRYVVMDEVHYLADRFRGPVWEEVILHLPRDVQIVSLSATVSNAEEFGAWLTEVRGDTEVVVEEHRPVPLWQHMLIGRELVDLFADDGRTRLNPDLAEQIRTRGSGGVAAIGREERGRSERGGRYRRGRRGRRDAGSLRGGGEYARAGGGTARSGGGFARAGGGAPSRPGRAEMLVRLDRDGLLPAITFIFSRVGCDAAVEQLLAAGLRLVTDREAAAIRRTVQERVSGLAPEDLGVLGYWDFVEGLTRGFAAHHAGMLPTFREIVEELFTAGRIRAVFATETLALGINMPARSVVLEKLVKFDGESHAVLTPAEYTQLTGRAGRRGIDVEGHAVVVWRPGIDPGAVAGLASTRTFPLRSSFRPTYNMTVNLVAQLGRERAEAVLERSFAQFQADASVVGLATAIRDNEAALAGYAEAMTCERGDFAQYAALRASLSELEKRGAKERGAARRAAVAHSLDALRTGDVLWLAGRHDGPAVVVFPAAGGSRKGVAAFPAIVTHDARLRRLAPEDLTEPVAVIASVTVPHRFASRSPSARRDLAATVRAKVPDLPRAAPRDAAGEGAERDERATQLAARVDRIRRELLEHPCHACPDREHHARWAERWHRLEKETAALRRRIEGRTSSVAREFRRTCDVLLALGYLTEKEEETGDGDRVARGTRVTRVTDDGRMLRRLYTEKDLLAAQCLRDGVWTELDAPGLAAAVSALVYEPRRGAGPGAALGTSGGSGGSGPDADGHGATASLPTAAVAAAIDAMVTRWSRLDDLEEAHRVPRTAYPDPGLASAMHRWAAGRPLESVLRESGLPAGDFVRRCKMTIDLLGQIADVAPQASVARTARKAMDLVMRGVVAADRLD